jgi:hypothetical protein
MTVWRFASFSLRTTTFPARRIIALRPAMTRDAPVVLSFLWKNPGALGRLALACDVAFDVRAPISNQATVDNGSRSSTLREPP